MKHYIYMKVTRGKYEFPVAMADTSVELARLVGVKQHSISSALCRVKSGKIRNCPYGKVFAGMEVET